MKKIAKVLLVLVLGLLAACTGKQGGSGGKQVTITLATSVYVEDPHRKAMDALLEAYKKIAPNVTIEIYGAGWNNYWDNVTTEIMETTKRILCRYILKTSPRIITSGRAAFLWI